MRGQPLPARWRGSVRDSYESPSLVGSTRASSLVARQRVPLSSGGSGPAGLAARFPTSPYEFDGPCLWPIPPHRRSYGPGQDRSSSLTSSPSLMVINGPIAIVELLVSHSSICAMATVCVLSASATPR